MTGETAACIVTIVTLIMKFGVPAALQIIREWDVENPTAEDFEALRKSVLKPQDYFEAS